MQYRVEKDTEHPHKLGGFFSFWVNIYRKQSETEHIAFLTGTILNLQKQNIS